MVRFSTRVWPDSSSNLGLSGLLIDTPVLRMRPRLASSSNLAREDCAIIVRRHCSALTAKEVFYDAPHSCIPGAGDIHSAVARPKQHPAHGSIWLYDRH